MKSIVILDRSGSMAQRWSDVAGALQSYFDGLEPGTKTWLMTFDTEHEEVWGGRRSGDANVLAAFEAKGVAPRGATALFDAIGRGAGLVAEVGKKRVQIVILTDGEENSSFEVDKTGAGRIIEAWKARGYDVIFLGADWDAFDEAGGIGIGAAQTLSVDTRLHAASAGSVVARRARRYGDGAAAASLAWSEADRREAGGETAAR